MAANFDFESDSLIRSVQKNRLDHVRLLLSEGYDINHADLQGNTGLIWAAILGHADCVRLLIQHPDINPNIRNRWGDSPLFLAGLHGNKEIFRLLINHSVIDVNLLYENDDSILSILVQNYCKKLVNSEEMLFNLLHKGFYFDLHLNSPVEDDRVNQIVYAFAGACRFKKINLQKILLEIGVWRMVNKVRVLGQTGEETRHLIQNYLPPTLSLQTRNFIRGTVYENVGNVNPNPALEAMAHESELPVDSRRCLLMQDRSLFTLD